MNFGIQLKFCEYGINVLRWGFFYFLIEELVGYFFGVEGWVEEFVRDWDR